MYETTTPETIEGSILSKITAFSTEEGSFARTLIAPAAYEIWKAYTALEGIPDMIFIDENSGPYIDKKAADFGITRKPGAKASGEITLTGRAGTVVPAGKVFLTTDGLGFTLDREIVIPESGSASGTVTAQEPGARYNVSAGEIVTQQTSLPGLTGFICGETVGGLEPETDAALVERYYSFLRKPATSGNVYQYQQWAESVPGVGQAKVYPLWDGPGTVKVVLSSQLGGVASPETVAACQAYIDSVRPIGAEVTVESAVALTVNVSAAVRASLPLETVKQRFAQAAAAYLNSIAFQKDEVVYSRLFFLLLDIEGVQDAAGFTVNSGTANIPIGDGEIPVLGEVKFT